MLLLLVEYVSLLNDLERKRGGEGVDRLGGKGGGFVSFWLVQSPCKGHCFQTWPMQTVAFTGGRKETLIHCSSNSTRIQNFNCYTCHLMRMGTRLLPLDVVFQGPNTGTTPLPGWHNNKQIPARCFLKSVSHGSSRHYIKYEIFRPLRHGGLGLKFTSIF